MKVFGIAGYSGSGKTTLLEKLLPQLTARGLKVSVIKHAHHGFDIDRPGKDSYRHREAGASEVLLACGDRVFDVHIKDVDKAAKDGRTVALGHGVIDIHRLVRTLRELRFTGVCGLEYESNKTETLPGLAETLGYLRGVLHST